MITTCHNVAKHCAFSKATYEIVEKEKEINKRHKHHCTAQHVSRLSGLTLWLESCKIRADWFSLSRPAAVTLAEMMISDECTTAFAAPEKENPLDYPLDCR